MYIAYISVAVIIFYMLYLLITNDKNVNIKWSTFFVTFIAIILFISVYDTSIPIIPNIKTHFNKHPQENPNFHGYPQENLNFYGYPQENLNFYSDPYNTNFMYDNTTHVHGYQGYPQVNPNFYGYHQENPNFDSNPYNNNFMYDPTHVHEYQESSEKNIEYMNIIINMLQLNINKRELLSLNSENRYYFYDFLYYAVKKFYKDSFIMKHVNSSTELDIFENNSQLPIIMFNEQNLLETIKENFVNFVNSGNVEKSIYAAVLGDYGTRKTLSINEFEKEILKTFEQFAFLGEYGKQQSHLDKIIHIISHYIETPILIFDNSGVRLFDNITDIHGTNIKLKMKAPICLFLDGSYYRNIPPEKLGTRYTYVYKYMYDNSVEYWTYEDIYKHYYLYQKQYEAIFIAFNEQNNLQIYLRNSENLWVHHNSNNILTTENLFENNLKVKIIIYKYFNLH